MLLGELTVGFPWGILLITDQGSKDEIPAWATAADQLTRSTSSVILKIRHEVDGPALVRVWDAEPPSPGSIVDECVLTISSGVLQVSDALGEQSVLVEVPVGAVTVRIMRSEPVYASQVDVVVEAGARPASYSPPMNPSSGIAS